jgi:hypothetical protein
MTINIKKICLNIGSATLLLLSGSPYAYAEDCSGLLPGANCTLDENTITALTIDNGIVLTVGASVTIGHTVDGSIANGDGSIITSGAGNIVIQNADIGSLFAIDMLSINDDNTWTTSSGIRTNNDGSDIDLGAADGGELIIPRWQTRNTRSLRLSVWE